MTVKVKIDRIDNLLYKAVLAQQKVRSTYRKIERERLEPSYLNALVEEMNAWQKSFTQYYISNQIGVVLFIKASGNFAGERPIAFKSNDESFLDENILGIDCSYNIHSKAKQLDYLNGLWIYNKELNDPRVIARHTDYPINEFDRIDDINFNELVRHDYILNRTSKLKSVDEVEEALSEFSFNEEALARILFIYNVKSFNIFSNLFFRSIDVNTLFALQNKEILDAIKHRAEKLAHNWANRSLSKIQKIIYEGYFVHGKHPTLGGTGTRGGTKTSIASDLLSFFDQNKAHCNTVARTEIMLVETESTFMMNKRVGVKRHGWLASPNLWATVRPKHKLNHLKVVEIGKPFPSGQIRVGEGSLDLVINCRCDNYGIVEGIPDEEQIWTGKKFDNFNGLLNKYNLFQV